MSRMGKNAMAVALGRRGGLKGGPARAAALTPRQRSAQARAAVEQRWRNRRLAAFMGLLRAQNLLANARLVRP
jgi:hypothetical protein